MPEPAMEASSPIITPDGHVIHWHDTGQKFLEAELAAVSNAQTSVRLEHYIFSASEIGARFREALTEAAKRGVKVTVLLDDVGCLGLSHSYFDEMVAEGGRLVWFNPMRWGFWPFRDHRKILVADETAFIGGCNIAAEYYGDGISQGWRDGGIEIKGPVVKYLVESFESQLEKAGNKIWRARKHGRNGRVEAGGNVSLLLMRPGFHQGILQRTLGHDLLHARDLSLTMAYFLPSGRFKRMLLRACKRARRFRMLLPAKSDVSLMQVASRALYRAFQKRGGQIYEYQPQVLHAKVIIVDDIVYVGSSNLDPRSLNINFEVMLRISSAELADRARATFDRDLEHSVKMANRRLSDPTTWWVRFKQKVAQLIFTRLDLGVAQYLAQKIERRRTRKGRQVSA